MDLLAHLRRKRRQAEHLQVGQDSGQGRAELMGELADESAGGLLRPRLLRDVQQEHRIPLSTRLADAHDPPPHHLSRWPGRPRPTGRRPQDGHAAVGARCDALAAKGCAVGVEEPGPRDVRQGRRR